MTLGNLNPTRDFTFVEDTCLAFEKFIKIKNLSGEIINIGSDNNVSIGRLAKKIITIMNSDIKIKIINYKKRGKKNRG